MRCPGHHHQGKGLLVIFQSVAFAVPLPDVDTPPKAGGAAPLDAAVVIGVEDYGYIPDVEFARRDADAFQAFLRATRGIPADRIRRVSDPDANREQILDAVRTMAGLVGSGGQLWVYYAGHGAADPATGERLLLGDDVKTDPTAWRARAVSVQELGDAASTASVLLVLDACFNGRGRDGAELSPGSRYAVPSWTAEVGPQVTVWAATSPNELAGPLRTAGHGAFTYFALGALRGWADGEGGSPRDGVVTLAEANAYVVRALRAAQQVGQTPEVRGDDGLVLVQRATEAGPDLNVVSGAATTPVASPFAILDVPERVVTFRSDPPGAQVLVDGSPRCEAAPTCARALPVGRHSVTFTLGRYEPYVVQLDVTDEPEPVVAKLTPLFGTLDVVLESAAPWVPQPGLRVQIDDSVLETPIRGHEVGYGTHRVRFDDPAWMPATQEVEVGKGEAKVVRMKVEPRLGGLKVVARDPDDGDDVAAEVFVDGRRVGRTPWASTLPIGTHVLVVGGDQREVQVTEAVTDQVEFLVRDVAHDGPSGWLLAGAGIGAAGAVVGLDTWALGAEGSTRVAANTAGWSAVGLGSALSAIGVYDTLHAGRPGRSAAVGIGLVAGAAGASLGALTALQGADETDPVALRRLTVLNTIGWSGAGAGATTAALAVLTHRRVSVGWRPSGPDAGTLLVGGEW